MRKLLLLMALVLVAAIALYRQRLFLRDPLGKVLVDGAEVRGAAVYINYSNDVLVMRDGGEPLLVQGWDRVPGRPVRLTCVRTLACLTDGDQAGKVALGAAPYDPKTTMGNREVGFVDVDGKTTRVVIR